MNYEPGCELRPQNYQLLSHLRALPDFRAHVLGVLGDTSHEIEAVPMRTLLGACWLLQAQADAHVSMANDGATVEWLDAAVGVRGFSSAAIAAGVFRLAQGVLRPTTSATSKIAAAERAKRYRKRKKLGAQSVATAPMPTIAAAPKAATKTKPAPKSETESAEAEDNRALADAFAASWAEHMSSGILASSSDTLRSAKQAFAAINTARKKAGDPAAPASEAKRFFDVYLHHFAAGAFCKKLQAQHGQVAPLQATAPKVAARVVGDLVRGQK